MHTTLFHHLAQVAVVVLWRSHDSHHESAHGGDTAQSNLATLAATSARPFRSRPTFLKLARHRRKIVCVRFQYQSQDADQHLASPIYLELLQPDYLMHQYVRQVVGLDLLCLRLHQLQVAQYLIRRLHEAHERTSSTRLIHLPDCDGAYLQCRQTSSDHLESQQLCQSSHELFRACREQPHGLVRLGD